ncbi:MAG: DUF58 domain-containing protein [Oscillospiraceae bacterium]
MAKYRLAYAALLVGCLIFAAAYQSRIASVLLAAVCVYPIAALVLTAISVFAIKPEFEAEQYVYEKNERFELHMIIHNNFLFPYAPAEFDCVLPDCETGLFLNKKVFASVAPLKRIRIFIPCLHSYRGSYTARVEKLTVYDPFRIISISRRLDTHTRLVFLPRKIPLDGLAKIFGAEQGTQYERHLDVSKESFSHVRDYVDGDLVQLIHWKLTAKLDSLMIKQYESESGRRSVILCNFGTEGAITSSAIIKQSDMVIETAVSFAMAAVSDGVKVLVDIGAASGVKYDISDNSGFRSFYEMMSVLPPAFDVVDYAGLIESYSLESASSLFLITPVINDRITAAARKAAEFLSGAVVLIYVNCSGKPLDFSPAQDSTLIFTQLRGEASEAVPAAAEAILTEYISQHDDMKL